MLSLENIMNDYYSNVPLIKIKNKLNINEILESIKTDIPFLLDNLRNEKNSIMSEFLTYIGINNVNITKKERLVKDEANANNELTEFDLQIFLSARQKAVEKINKKFGTNIEVKARTDIIKKFKELLEKEGDENNDTI